MKFTRILYRYLRPGKAAPTIFSFGLILFIAGMSFSCSSGSASRNATNVSINGDRWLINGEPVLKGTPAEGLLVNVRMVNAVFEDAGKAGEDFLPEHFDPEENTNRFIAQISDYYAHGVRAFTISLQGGLPGYEGAVNSAFNADGSLRETYLGRVTRVIRAADEYGVVVILSCFYQRQHSHQYALDGKDAIRNAVENVAQWIVHQEFRNVVLEISNEFGHGGYNRWKDGEWVRSVDGQVELVRHAKTIAPDLLVSTSGMGGGSFPQPLAEAADFLLIHFNGTPINLIPERIREARNYGKPVVCNEDNKIGRMGAEAARVSIKSGAGWGFMHIKKNQSAPFGFDGANDDAIVYQRLKELTTSGGSIEEIPSEPLSVLITDPLDGDVFDAGEAITLRANVSGFEGTDEMEVHFVVNGKLVGKGTKAPWEISWEDADAGKYDVMAAVKSPEGAMLLRSIPVDFEVAEGKSHP